MIRTVIADDHPIVLQGLRRILEEAEGVALVAEASDGHELLRRIEENPVDVVVLDIAMPGLSGLDALKEIRRRWPDLPALVLSVHPEDEFAVRLLKAGAAGYMNKASALDDLVNAIRKVHAGGRWVSPALAEVMADSLGHEEGEVRHARLSDREYQVMCRLAQGRTVSAIAEELALSVKTVSTYRRRVLEKTGLSNNAELTYYCLQNKLVN
jgi:DNA-binding NarL/FixJ family response regulator